MTETMSALKTSPGSPRPPRSLPAAQRCIYGVSALESSNMSRACLSGSWSGWAGNSMGDAPWRQLHVEEEHVPSLVARLRSASVALDGSPSVASPSVMLMTMGGKLSGCCASQREGRRAPE